MKPAAVLLRRAGLAGLVLVLLGAFGWVLARTGPLAPIRVTTAQVEEGALAPELFGIGSVEARRSYLIGPTAAGRVLRVVVDVGDTVTSAPPRWTPRLRVPAAWRPGPKPSCVTPVPAASWQRSTPGVTWSWAPATS